MISLRSAAVATVSAAAVLLAPTPALADDHTQLDAVRDVARITIDQDGDPVSAVARGETDLDIRSVRFDLGERRLVVVAKMRSIGPRVRLFGVVRTRVTTYDLTVSARGRLRIDDRNAGRRACAGAVARTDPGARAYRLSVPASCLGSPRWARLGFAVARYRQSATLFSIVVDDAGRIGYHDPSADIAVGPRIARG